MNWDTTNMKACLEWHTKLTFDMYSGQLSVCMEFFNELLHLLESNPTMQQAQSFGFKCAK